MLRYDHLAATYNISSKRRERLCQMAFQYCFYLCCNPSSVYLEEQAATHRDYCQITRRSITLRAPARIKDPPPGGEDATSMAVAMTTGPMTQWFLWTLESLRPLMWAVYIAWAARLNAGRAPHQRPVTHELLTWVFGGLSCFGSGSQIGLPHLSYKCTAVERDCLGYVYEQLLCNVLVSNSRFRFSFPKIVNYMSKIPLEYEIKFYSF